MGIEAFCECRKLSNAVLNEGLQKIEEGSFYNCRSLRSIKLPSTSIKIGIRAFGWCTELNEVHLNEGLQKIEKGAFYECQSLRRINLPSNLIEIEAGVFRDCTALSDVLVNEKLQNVWIDEFRGCPSLQRIIFPCISIRLESIICDEARVSILNKIHDGPFLAMADGEMLIYVETIRQRDWNRCNWNSYNERLDRILCLITYYELKEATAVFELALWKAKMIEEIIENDSNRQSCRIEVPGPAKEAVEQYFPNNQSW
eukprot:CAMPEP_0183746164 /NCGR_PEP_ID=MMETSP0737-20130205/66611_1 /TAXON_ID=385413 /ORGANISM="Thalassiosira miniscula, Strain CCMP1093" /LENGTH=256 /DNA_ID=CAMNT_0025981845 /DNA_START=960 /DNA_END=1727 /DNA_ORIENTATION=+